MSRFLELEPQHRSAVDYVLTVYHNHSERLFLNQ
jgi:hypothetical protein